MLNKIRNFVAAIELHVYLTLSFCALLVHVFIYRSGNIDFSAPIFLEGDANFIYAIIKTIIDRGWWWSINPSISYPFGVTFVTHPAIGNMEGIIFKIISLFFNDIFLIANIALCLSSIITVVFSYFCLRLFKITKMNSFLFSVIFAFIPPIYSRSIHHFNLLLHAVPPLASISILLYTNALKNLSKSKLMLLFFLLIVCGSSYVYNVFFACFCVCFAMIFGCSKNKNREDRKKQLKHGFLLLISLLFIFLLNNIPAFIASNKYQVDFNSRKIPAQADLYGLRIRDLITPTGITPIRPLRIFSEKVRNANFPLSNENTAIKMGAILSLMFLYLLVNIFLQKKIKFKDEIHNEFVHAISFTILACILFATIGGFGSVFNLLITPAIRAYNRIGHFIAFYCTIALGIFFTHWELKLAKTLIRRCLWTFFLIALTVLGLYDQRLWKALPSVSKAEVLEPSKETLSILDETMPQGTNILYMPYSGLFSPKTVKTMPYYGHLVPFLLSNRYNWSVFAMVPEAERVLRELCSLKGEILVYEARKRNFTVIWIDKRDYQDNGKSIIDSLSALEGVQYIHSNNIFTLFDIRDVSFTNYISSLPSLPFSIKFGLNTDDRTFILSGFSNQEKGFRWTVGNKAIIIFEAGICKGKEFFADINLSPFIDNVKLKAQRVKVSINGEKYDEWLISEDTIKRIIFQPTKGKEANYILEFYFPDAISPKKLGMSSDERYLGLAFKSILFSTEKDHSPSTK